MRKLPSKSFKLCFCVLFVIEALSFVSCKKEKALPVLPVQPVSPGCGCTALAVDTAYYGSFLGFDINFVLWYDDAITKPGWFVSGPITDPYGGTFGAICKICNTDLPGLKKITDTASKKYNIPVLFAGKLKNRCEPDTNWGDGGGHLLSTLLFYISLDSIIRR